MGEEGKDMVSVTVTQRTRSITDISNSIAVSPLASLSSVQSELQFQIAISKSLINIDILLLEVFLFKRSTQSVTVRALKLGRCHTLVFDRQKKTDSADRHDTVHLARHIQIVCVG